MATEPDARGGDVYVGPRPFRTGERLFGRDAEVTALTSLLIGERVVLLYAPSGAGKTSLVQAGLVPVLRHKRFHAPAVAGNPDPLAPTVVVRVHLPLPADAPSANRYLLSTLLSLEEHRLPAGRRKAVELAGLSLADYLKAEFPARGEGRSGFRPLVLVFDQFEEVLTLDPTDTAVKQEFIKHLGEALGDGSRWALFSIREDHLAALEPYLPRLPTRVLARYRLDRLDLAAALEAVCRPAEEAGVAFDAAEELVDDLRRVQVQQPDNTFVAKLGPHVEPVHLQVVCRGIWDRARRDREAAGQRLERITADDLAKLSGPSGHGVDAALAAYYADRVAAAAAAGQTPERRVRDWFGKVLITTTSARKPALSGEEVAAGVTPGCRAELDRAFLIRAESRGGATWLELAHDRLIDPIRQDNARWRAANLNPFQLQAEVWAATRDRPDDLLAIGDVLVQGEAWAAANSASLTDEEKLFLRVSQERRTACQVDQHRKDEEVRRQAEEAQRQAKERQESLQREAKEREDRLRLARFRVALAGAGLAILLLTVVVGLTYRNMEIHKQRMTDRELADGLQAEKHAWEDKERDRIAAEKDAQLAAARQREADTDRAQRVLELRSEVAQAVRTDWPSGREAAERALSLADRPEAVAVIDAENFLRRALQTRHWTSLNPLLTRSTDEPVPTDGPRAEGAEITALAYHPELDRLMVATRERGPTPGGTRASLYQLSIGPSKPIQAVPAGTMPAAAGVEVTALAFHPHEEAVVLGDSRGTLYTHRPSEGRPAIRTLAEPQKPEDAVAVRSIRFGADGKWLTSYGVGRAGQLFRWTVPDKAERIPLEIQSGAGDPGSPIAITALTPSPKKMYVGTAGGRILACDLERTPHELKDAGIEPLDSGISALAIDPRARFLALGSATPAVKLRPMDPTDRSLKEGTLQVPTTAGTDELQFSPDGEWLLALTHGRAITVFPRAGPAGPDSPDPSSAFTAPARLPMPETLRISSAAFGPTPPNGPHWLMGVGSDGAALWDLRQVDAAPRVLAWNDTTVAATVISPKGTTAVAVTTDGQARLWDLARAADDLRAEPRVLRGHHHRGQGRGLLGGCFSPDGRQVATLGRDGEIRVWDLGPAAPVAPKLIDIRAGLKPWQGLEAFAFDGPTVTVAAPNGQPPRRWDLTAAAPSPVTVAGAPALGDTLGRVVLSPDGRWLATYDYRGIAKGSVVLESLATPGLPPRQLVQNTRQPAPLQFRPRYPLMAFSSDSGRLAVFIPEMSTLEVWQLGPSPQGATRELAVTLGHSTASALAVSRDGKSVAVGADGGQVTVVRSSAPDPKYRLVLPGHRRAVRALAFTPGGDRLISGSADGTARVWDVRPDRTGLSPVILDGHTGGVFSVAVSPDGSHVLTTSDDGTARVWALDRKLLIERARQLLDDAGDR
jgi:WD40 repeat protein